MPVGARPRDIEELLTKLRYRLVIPTPERRPGGLLGFADAAHLGAQVHRFQIQGYPVCLEDARQRVPIRSCTVKRLAKSRTNRVSLEIPMMCSWAT